MDPELLNNLFESIKHLTYVVMRNWRDLPDMDKLHPDLDIMVSTEDYQEMKLLCPEWVDLRTPTDGYFPLEIAFPLLSERREFRNFFIPSPEYYFISLYYHAVIHKENFENYQVELKRAYMEWIKPVRCEDKGVGYFL